MYRINTIKLVKAALDPQEKTDRDSNILRFVFSPVASTLFSAGLLGGTGNLIGRLLTAGNIDPEAKKKIRRRLTTAGLLLGGIRSVPGLARGYREQGLKGLINIPNDLKNRIYRRYNDEARWSREYTR